MTIELSNRIRTAHRSTVSSVSLSKRRMWFAGEPPPPPPVSPVVPPVVPPPEPPPADKPGDKKAYTQAELDAMFADRAKRAKESATADLMKELGVESTDALKAALQAKKDADEKGKTELEKAQAALADAEKKAADAESAAAALKQERLIELRDNRIKAAFLEAHSTNPQKVLVLMNAEKLDMVKAVLKEDGSIDDAKLKALVEDARKSQKEYFRGSGPGTTSLRGGQNPDPDTGKEAAQKQAFQRARRDI